MEYSYDMQGQQCNVRMNGKFIFEDNAQFKSLFSLLEEHPMKTMNVDVAEISFMDSAALGMLLLLRDKAASRGVKLALLRPQGQVKKVFSISRFDSLFTIHSN